MKPVFQTVIHRGLGDCFTAAIASLLELTLDEVPYFRVFDEEDWFIILCEFLEKHGYKHDMCCDFFQVMNDEAYNVKGYAIALVPSKTFDNCMHSVIVNRSGLVVHDPNPNKAWLDINILQTSDFERLHCIKRKESNGSKD